MSADSLVDRQTVRVEGRGFVRSERPLVRLFQCGTSADPDLGERCRPGPNQTAELDADGSFAADVPVSTIIGTDGDPVDCRTASAACSLEAVAAGQNHTVRTAARAALAFDPDAAVPEWPSPEVTVTPTTDLDDVQAVSVHGSDFSAGATVQIWQCPAADPHPFCTSIYVVAPAADADGVIDTEVAVEAVIDMPFRPEDPPGSDRFDCRQPPGCVLIARDVERGIEITTPLSFGVPEPGRRYLDPVFDEVDVLHDIVYRETVDAHGNPVELSLDIYRPRGDVATSRPATVWMHGGFFRGGDKSQGDGFATLSARYGQVGVAIDYRVRPDATGWRDMYLASLDAYDDATAAIQWLQQHAADYGIDPDAIFASGFSAGAVTAYNLAYLPGQRGPEQSLIAAAFPESGLLYTPPERGEPPTMAFHGTNDGLLPYDNVASLCPQAARVDVPCELLTYQGIGHGVGSGADRLRRSSAFAAEHVLGPSGYFDVTADAGGPYEVEEGSTVALDGTASAGEDLSYSWSPADRVTDPGSASPRVAGLDDGTEPLGLTVTSSHGVADQTESQLTTTNVAPSIETMDLPTGTTGQRVTLAAAVTDPGLLDTHTATIDWGDGTIEAATVEQAAGRAAVVGDHTYPRAGEYEVSLTVTDDDGGSDQRTSRIAVGCTVLGTEHDDRLVGTDGDDVLCGLGGDDRLRGGRGDDRMFGGPGDDRLDGGRGDDELIGGPGTDRASGGPGADRCAAERRRSCH